MLGKLGLACVLYQIIVSKVRVSILCVSGQVKNRASKSSNGKGKILLFKAHSETVIQSYQQQDSRGNVHYH